MLYYEKKAGDKQVPFPNPDTQFKPGESGNPNGVPKGTKQINTWINELLNDEKFTAKIKEGYEVKEYKGAPIKAIIQAQVRLAINGDTKAADMLFKHGGVQRVQLGNDPENPLVSPDTEQAAKYLEWLKANA